MPKFAYKAHDAQNRMLVGSTDGATVDDVIEKLTQRNLLPVNVEELNFDGTQKNQPISERIAEGFKKFQGRVPYKNVVFFTRQLATMIAGGVPLARALEQLARSETPALKKVILQVAEDISMGYSFSDAVARHPGAFDNMFVSVVRSGEVSGLLDEVLDQMATYMENIEAIKSKIKAAMRYPMFIGLFVVVLVIGILWKLVPTFAGIYASFGAKLPGPTLILVAASNFIQHNMLLVIGSVILAIIGFNLFMLNDRFKLWIDTNILKLPVFGGILRKNIWANFCRTMALLMESGTPILEAIEISAGVVNSKLYSQALQDVYANLRTGELLSASLEKAKIFPVLIMQLISTGEESGKVDDLLRKAAEFYEREIKNVVDSLASIIEPFMIIILGGSVGAILIALYMPIFMIGKLISR